MSKRKTRPGATPKTGQKANHGKHSSTRCACCLAPIDAEPGASAVFVPFPKSHMPAFAYALCDTCADRVEAGEVKAVIAAVEGNSGLFPGHLYKAEVPVH